MSEDLIDELDAALVKAVSVHPSPEFVARTRRRIAHQRERTRRAQAWGAAALGMAAIVTLAVVTWPHHRDDVFSASTRSVLASRAAPPPGWLGFLVEAMPATDLTTSSASAQRSRRRSETPVPNEPEVLIDRGEARALRVLIERAASGLIVDVVAPNVPTVDAGAAAKIDISPIELQPLKSDQEGALQ
jgi:hypothetical protein